MAVSRKKLIEVALPLETINREVAKERNTPALKGHPRNLHLWWSRKPLAACRAILFASLVDDPSSHPERFPTEEAQELGRKRLFGIIEELVKWKNSNNEEILARARGEIMRSCKGNPPPVLDPFCGGGSIPLEAQRLGMEAHASDLNPVASLITRALVEIPRRFSGHLAVHPDTRTEGSETAPSGVAGLARDVRLYGRWVRDEAWRRIGHLYPKAKLPPYLGGGEATVLAWRWARTVICPNPACGTVMPLVWSFSVSEARKQKVWLEPLLDMAPGRIRFAVRTGEPGPSEGVASRRGARCLSCGRYATLEHVRREGSEGRMSTQLITVFVEGRAHLTPDEDQEDAAAQAQPAWGPDAELVLNTRHVTPVGYGIRRHKDLYTGRQLVALTTLCDLVPEARQKVLGDARAAGRSKDAVEYADAISTYLALAISRTADYCSTLYTWDGNSGRVRNTFSRQALPMTWDFVETNVFTDGTGSFFRAVDSVAQVLERLCPDGPVAQTFQGDTRTKLWSPHQFLICTDPPYYDNVPYADLADYFYVWLRRALAGVYPEVFSTVLTPKSDELVADTFRQGGKEKARRFFEKGIREAFEALKKAASTDYPLVIFYAFKQAESKVGREEENADASVHVASTGWETMLEGLLAAGFAITGAWPVRTEMGNRVRSLGSNALASSIVLVCRPRPETAPAATLRDFLKTLKKELPDALRKLQQGNIAPVDLAQAAIGPGMAVFSRYSGVQEASGKPVTVRSALGHINRVLDEVLAEQEGEFDADTRWALAWFEQHGFSEGLFGDAETLSKAKNTSVQGMIEAGILRSRGGKAQLIKREDLPADWDPGTDTRLTIWEMTQHLICALQDGGEEKAADLLKKIGSRGEIAKDLAYRLYTTCERKKWSQEGVAYNSLVASWPEVVKLAGKSCQATFA